MTYPFRLPSVTSPPWTNFRTLHSLITQAAAYLHRYYPPRLPPRRFVFLFFGQPAAYRALAVLAKAARECVGNFRPQDISMVSLALARMSWDDPRLMKAMATRTTETLRAFK